MEKITFENTFHNTSVNSIIKKDASGKYLTVSQLKRVERELCGMRDCHCGGFWGTDTPREDFIEDYQSAWFEKRPNNTKIYF